MLERFWLFFPSALTILLIGGGITLFMRLRSRKYRDRINSIAWIEENASMLAKTYMVTALCIAPALEELLFRFPLLVAFPDAGGSAWIWILVSGVIFGLSHIGVASEAPGVARDLMREAMAGELESDDFKVEMKKFLKRNRGRYTTRIALKVAITTGLGIVLGFITLHYRSLWLAVLVHFVWNLLMPIVVELVITAFLFLSPKKRRRRAQWARIDEIHKTLLANHARWRERIGLRRDEEMTREERAICREEDKAHRAVMRALDEELDALITEMESAP